MRTSRGTIDDPRQPTCPNCRELVGICRQIIKHLDATDRRPNLA